MELWEENDECDHRMVDMQRMTEKESLGILANMKSKFGLSYKNIRYSPMRSAYKVTFYFKRSDLILVLFCTEKQKDRLF